MHTWKPDAYSEAPVRGGDAGGWRLNCALYGLVRFYVLTSVPGPRVCFQLLILFGLLSIGVAVPFILVQRNFRRLLAYSSIDHGGIMVLGLGFGGPLGPGHAAAHDLSFHYQTPAFLLRRQCPAASEDGSVSRSERRTDPFHAVDRGRFSPGDAGGHRHASLQPVSERVHDSARRLQRRLSPFSAFSSSRSSSRSSPDSSCHIANLVLGPDPGLPPGRVPAAGRSTLLWASLC